MTLRITALLEILRKDLMAASLCLKGLILNNIDDVDIRMRFGRLNLP
jgi:hypothetical protein